MKVLGYKLTLLAFFITLLSGFYMRLSLVDNLVRSFVVYLIFSVIYLGAMLFYNHITLMSARSEREKKQQKEAEELKNATPNIAK